MEAMVLRQRGVVKSSHLLIQLVLGIMQEALHRYQKTSESLKSLNGFLRRSPLSTIHVKLTTRELRHPCFERGNPQAVSLAAVAMLSPGLPLE